MPPKVSAAVVLYQPQPDVLENILSYSPFVQRVYVVDNSDSPDLELIRQLKEVNNVIFIDNSGNQGIANALNRGAKEAIAAGDEWLLTMDQDSKATSDCLPALLSFIEHNQDERIAIVSAFQLMGDQVPPAGPITEPLTTITSGNMLNLKCYAEVGPFEDKLFIDYVDHEYDLRLRRNGYKIIQVNSALLEHELGDYGQSKIGRKTYGYTNHSALRRYYITRNRLYVMRLYKKDFPQFYRREREEMWKEFIKIVLFEEHKLAKLAAVWHGIRDFQKNRFGKYPAAIN